MAVRLLIEFSTRAFLLRRATCDKVLAIGFLVLVLNGWCQSAPAPAVGKSPTESFPPAGLDSGYPRAKFSESADTHSDENTISKRATQSTTPIKIGEGKPAANDAVKLNLGNATAINSAISSFVRSAENIIREILVSSQTGMLRVIGQVDHGLDTFQKRLQNSSFRLTLAGQKAAAQAYEALPPAVNTIIQRLGSPTDSRSRELTVKLNEVVNNFRQLTKQFYDAWEEHEYDFHNVFQDRFTQINQYLRVPELPRRVFGWH